MSMKNSNDTIGNRSRDLPVCSAVPQPLRHRVPPTVEVTDDKMISWNGYKWRLERAVQVNGRGLFSSKNVCLVFSMRDHMTNFASFRANQAQYGRVGDTNVINRLIKQVCTLSIFCDYFKSLVFHPVSTFYNFHNKSQSLPKVSTKWVSNGDCCFLWSENSTYNIICMYVVCLNISVNGTRKQTKQKIQTN
jgi:hypothetical protein